jgi:hypothetical protein
VKYLKAVLLLLVTAVAMTALPAMADDPGPELKINRSKSDKCVEPTDVMRRDHMEFLLHQRDETMHKGIRTKKYSLKECIECHANKDEEGKYIPVNAEGEFCQSCHAYASVKLDCFECHATKPRQNTAFHPMVSPGMEAYREVHQPGATRTLLNKAITTN